MGVQRAPPCGGVSDVLMVYMRDNTTRKADRYMMNKRARKSRIGLAFAGITAGMLGLWAPTAGADGEHRAPRTVRVVVPPAAGGAGVVVRVVTPS